jgi:hypothetical protein
MPIPREASSAGHGKRIIKQFKTLEIFLIENLLSRYFHLAVTFGNHEIAKRLVEFGSETEDFDEHTGYQVFYAAEVQLIFN